MIKNVWGDAAGISPLCTGMEYPLCTLEPGMLAFRGVGDDGVAEGEVVLTLSDVNSAGSKSERTTLPATLVLSSRSRSGGVRGVNELTLQKTVSVQRRVRESGTNQVLRNPDRWQKTRRKRGQPSFSLWSQPARHRKT